MRPIEWKLPGVGAWARRLTHQNSNGFAGRVPQACPRRAPRTGTGRCSVGPGWCMGGLPEREQGRGEDLWRDSQADSAGSIPVIRSSERPCQRRRTKSNNPGVVGVCCPEGYLTPGIRVSRGCSGPGCGASDVPFLARAGTAAPIGRTRRSRVRRSGVAGVIPRMKPGGSRMSVGPRVFLG